MTLPENSSAIYKEKTSKHRAANNFNFRGDIPNEIPTKFVFGEIKFATLKSARPDLANRTFLLKLGEISHQ